MTMKQLQHLKPLLNVRLLCEEAGLSYPALSAKLYRFGARRRKSELTAPESEAVDAALARLLQGAGLTATRTYTPNPTATTATPSSSTAGGDEQSDHRHSKAQNAGGTTT